MAGIPRARAYGAGFDAGELEPEPAMRISVAPASLFEPNEQGLRMVPMSIGTAERIMSIRQNALLVDAKSAHVPILPPSWGTLYQLAALPEDTLKRALADGKVHADMERKDVWGGVNHRRLPRAAGERQEGAPGHLPGRAPL